MDLDRAIRDLASSINQTGPDATFESVSLRKGIVRSVTYTATNAQISVNLSGDEEVLIEGVMCVNTYSPYVNDVVLLAKQGNGLIGLGAVQSSGGWMTLTLNSGYNYTAVPSIHNPLQCRVAMLSGSPVVQFRGNIGVGSGGDIASLPQEVIPNSYRTTPVGTSIGVARINTDANGELQVQHLSTATWVAFDNSSFPLYY